MGGAFDYLGRSWGQTKLEAIEIQNLLRHGMKARPNGERKWENTATLVPLGLESKLRKGCWSGADFLCLSCAICMQSENSSGSCFTQSEQSCISHPMLPGEWVNRQVWHSMSLQPVLFRGLGLAQRLPKGTRMIRRRLWQGPELATHAKACQCLGTAKADRPKDTGLNTVMWNSWSGPRQSVFLPWEQPCLVMSWAGHRVGLTSHDFALQLPPGFIFGGDTAMTDRTGNTKQLLCRVRRGQETLDIYLNYLAFLSARTQRKSTVTTSKGLVLFSTLWGAYLVCTCACVGAPPRNPAVLLKKTACLQHGSWRAERHQCTAKGGCFRHRPWSQGFLMSSCSTIAACMNFLLYFHWNFHIRGQVYPLAACSCSSGPISTSG